MSELIKRYSKLFPKRRRVRIALLIIGIWSLVALLAPYLEMLVGVGYGDIMPEEGLLPPFSEGTKAYHFLGTDYLGRDLLSGLIHGARVAFIISFLSVFVALLFGLSVGLIIGYYGDHGIKKNIIQQLILVISIVFVCYYTIACFTHGVSIYNVIPIVITIFGGYGLERLSSRLPLKSYGVPLDIIIQRMFELRESIPGIFLILAIAALFSSPSIISVALVISVLYWFTFARYTRVETWSVKEESYIKSAISSGVSDTQLLWRHILPNALPSIYVIIAFTFSGVILLESTLSFLGIGIPVEEISWGKILAGAKKSTKAWWLAVFPGLAIFLVLFAFNTLGDYLAQYQKRNDE